MKFVRWMFVVAAIAAMVQVSQAGSLVVSTWEITPTMNPFSSPVNTGIYTGLNNSQSQINQDIAPLIGGVAADLILYKQNVGGSEEGLFKENYTTTFSNSPNDPSGALIKWDNFDEPFINKLYDFLLVKDGNHNPAWYLFDLGNWNGKDTLSLSGFWPQQGAISHVSLYGRGTPVVVNPQSTAVPEPSSLVIATIAAIGGIFAMRRRKQAVV